MLDDWELHSLAAGGAIWAVYEFLANGGHEHIPLDGQTISIQAGLALTAIAGVAINSYVYDER